METTLAERLALAMKGPPKITGLALAKHCAVAAPSVSDWLRGKTKTLEANNLIKAAEFLKVRPKWLASGIGPRYITSEISLVPRAQEPEGAYTSNGHDAYTQAAIELFKMLDPPQREGALATLRTYVGNLGQPQQLQNSNGK